MRPAHSQTPSTSRPATVGHVTGVSPEGLHSLTLVMSSARSGSTLLCRDIASLGGSVSRAST